MEVAFVLFMLFGLSVFLVSGARRAKGKGRRSLMELIAQKANRNENKQFPDSDLLGLAGDLRVRVEKFRRGKFRGTRLAFGGLGHGSGGLYLRREGPLSATPRFAEREIKVGDETFDGDVYVLGSVPLVRAILDAETRPLLRRLLCGELTLADGSAMKVRARVAGDELQIEIPGTPGVFALPSGASPRDIDRLAEAFQAAIPIARRLVAPGDIPGRIALNLGREPEAGVRLRSLLTLIREFPDHPATRNALLAAREDASDEVRLQAAIVLGEEGLGVLLDLASRKGTTDACAARAIEALGGRLPRERCREILWEAIGSGRGRTAIACMKSLVAHGKVEAVETLAEVLRGKPGAGQRVQATISTDLRAAAARALGETGAPAAEAPLVLALRNPVPRVRVAAAEALGGMGSVAAVPPLREVEKKSLEDGLKRAARQAVARIQARVSGAEPGQLSLAGAEGPAGMLSLAGESEAGRLSFPPEDVSGRLSLGGPEAPGGEPPAARKPSGETA